jgi:CRISPR/Cas system-associated endonuclease Cas3-HD|tara:strand:+ start:7025 stop:7780 length:756 start_codon:yes stop_codon:yes gene_type:complete
MSDDYITDKPEFTSADIQMYDREGNETTREKMQVKRGAVLHNQGQRRELIDGKLTIENVRWLDEERTLVQAKYFDSEGWGRVENHAANASGPGTFFSKILQQYTIDDIDEDTKVFWQAEEAALEEYQQFKDWKDSGGILNSQIDEDEIRAQIEHELRSNIESEKEVIEKVIEKVEEVPVEVPTISVEHMAKNYSQEDLFRMKIEVFDIPAVRDASKDIKSRIRKASTPVELFSIIHEANVSFENAQASQKD